MTTDTYIFKPKQTNVMTTAILTYRKLGLTQVAKCCTTALWRYTGNRVNSVSKKLCAEK